jgi:hypothetical protein
VFNDRSPGAFRVQLGHGVVLISRYVVLGMDSACRSNSSVIVAREGIATRVDPQHGTVSRGG